MLLAECYPTYTAYQYTCLVMYVLWIMIPRHVEGTGLGYG